MSFRVHKTSKYVDPTQANYQIDTNNIVSISTTKRNTKSTSNTTFTPQTPRLNGMAIRTNVSSGCCEDYN